MSGRALPVVGSDAPWSGGQVTSSVHCVLAPNPSPWTLDGTNTWIIGERDAVIIDPGPVDAGHAAAIRRHIEEHDLTPIGVVITHGHLDHSESASDLAMSLGVGVRAVDPQRRWGDEGLSDGAVIDLGSDELVVLATPGHSGDSASLVLRRDRSLVSGDTVLGRGTSVVAWPDGNLAQYLDSLQRLRDRSDDVDRILPGHGPVLDDPARILEEYLAHRDARLQEVREVFDSGVTEPAHIVEIVYASVPREVWPAAELSVRAQVEYLTTER